MPYDSKLGPIPAEHFEKDHVYDPEETKARVSPESEQRLDARLAENVKQADAMRAKAAKEAA